jgi:hypothetical protein
MGFGPNSGGALVVLNNIGPENEDLYNDWYTNEHLPERVGIKGFVRGRRFAQASSAAARKYLTIYEVEELGVLASPAYVERLDAPTEWTRRVAPLFLDTIRSACSLTATAGRGDGGQITLVEVRASRRREAELRAWLTQALKDLVEHPEIVSAHLLESDIDVTGAKNTTAESCSMADNPAAASEWLLVVESGPNADLEDTITRITAAELANYGAHTSTNMGSFHLLALLDS